MRFSLTTWNINSVRLRIDLVAKFLKAVRPDVLCLQETKCVDDAFPLKRFRRLGYEHIALNGQKGYHGVAVVSKLPFETTDIRTFCDKIDSRHISVAFGEKAQLSKPLVVHNFYVPAGGDIADPALNPKFAHKLQFLDEMKACEPLHPRGDDRHILVGDLNVAPHENDVWSHKQLLKVVSHTPIECEKLLAAQAHGEWFDVARDADPAVGKSLYVVELSRRGLDAGRSRPQARPHLGFARAQGRRQRFPHHARCARLGAALRPRSGHGDAGDMISAVVPAKAGTHRPRRGLQQNPSARFPDENPRRMDRRVRGDDDSCSAQILSFAPAIRISLAIWLVRLANSSRSRRAAAGSLSSTR